jgi:hypothetical protein
MRSPVGGVLATTDDFNGSTLSKSNSKAGWPTLFPLSFCLTPTHISGRRKARTKMGMGELPSPVLI